VRSRLKFVAALLCVAVMAAACGDDGGTTTEPTGTGGSGATGQSTTTAAPQAGGEVKFGTFSEAVSLDPVKMTGSGVTGAIELSAIYDTVVGYDPATKKYVPRTAESVTPNADFTEWTLKLKPGIKFGDGTDYNADAVIKSITRHQDPTNPTVSRGTSAIIKAMAAVDATTVKFTLTDPWAGFPYVLADKVGMIVSPTAVAKYGKDFGGPAGYEGAGAGPFSVESYKPKEALVLHKNAAYHGGAVYLDRVTFVNILGAAATYEALKAGTVQLAFLREAAVIAKATDDGYKGFSNIQEGGSALSFNLGATVTCAGGKPEPICTGKADNTAAAVDTPTQNLKVRQALLAAIDTNVINQRVFEGKGRTGPELFKKGFPWYSADAASSKYDVEAAKKLVTEAKAAGWNGKVRLNCANTPENQNTATAVESMWKAAGIDVTVSANKSTADHVQQYLVAKDFDAVCSGYNIGPDDGAVNTLNTNFKSPGSKSRWGYSSPEMDGLLTEARKAATDDAKRDVFKRIQDLYTKDAIGLPFAATNESVLWDKKVNGVVPSQQTVVYLDKAWLSK
jgi:peptide/nickel transport system substrate-binding protein